MDPEREALVRQYAAGDISWRELQHRSFEDDVEVLAGLGELGLHPPTARMIGPNVEARLRGKALLERLLTQPR